MGLFSVHRTWPFRPLCQDPLGGAIGGAFGDVKMPGMNAGVMMVWWAQVNCDR